jgi:hypothetical protein
MPLGFRPSARLASRRTAVRGQTALQTEINTVLDSAHLRCGKPLGLPPDGSQFVAFRSAKGGASAFFRGAKADYRRLGWRE